MEKTSVTEIKVRMDCNGCVHKIKKALHKIAGISDFYIDFPQQKITIIGWADPVMIVKAIKKTRKSAVICSHTEQPQEPASEGEAPEGGSPPEECPNTSTDEAKSPAKAPITSPAPENPQSETKSSNESENTANQSTQSPKTKDVEEIHVIHHHPPDYGYRYAYGHNLQQESSRQWGAYPNGMGYIGEPYQPYYQSSSGLRAETSPYARGMGNRDDPIQMHSNTPRFRAETSTRNVAYQEISPQPSLGNPGFAGESSHHVHVTHSYNTYKPSPYVTEYAYPYSQPIYSNYQRPDHYNNGGNGSITSMFSEENPNACKIV